MYRTDKKIAVLLPCYNEEGVVGLFYEEAIKHIKKCPCDYELIFVNDGSKDKTVDILEEYKNKYGIEWYQGQNCGSAKSFMDLVRKIEGYDFSN